MTRYPVDIDRRIKELEREKVRRSREKYMPVDVNEIYAAWKKDREMYVTLEDHLDWFVQKQMVILARFEVLFREAGDDHEGLMVAKEALLGVTELHKNAPPAISDKYKEALAKVTEETEAK